MVFKTVTDKITGVTKSISFFNSTFSVMKENIRSGQGIFYSIFAGDKLTQKDIQSITNYANALKNGADVSQAWSGNMQNCSVAATEYVTNARNAGKTADELTAGLQGTTLSAKAG